MEANPLSGAPICADIVSKGTKFNTIWHILLAPCLWLSLGLFSAKDMSFAAKTDPKIQCLKRHLKRFISLGLRRFASFIVIDFE